MPTSFSEIINNAEHAFLNGKRGTFAIVRTPDGSLWYAAPGVQTEVKFLRITLQDQLFDETSFTGTLIIRSNPKNGDQWFVLYNPDNAKSPYVASSHDEIHDFSLSAIANAPSIAGCTKEPITIQAAFHDSNSAVSRLQNADIARFVILQNQVTKVTRQLNRSTYNAAPLNDEFDPYCGTSEF